MTFSDLFKVMIIQRQITWKWYNIELYLQWPTNRKSYTIYRTAPFLTTLNNATLTPSFKVTPFFDAEYLRNGTTLQTQCHWNTNRDLNKPYATVTFRMTLSHLEWLSKIFNDTKRRSSGLSATADLLVLESITVSIDAKQNLDTIYLDLAETTVWFRNYKKLSYRRVTAQRFLSWNILLSHSVSLKIIWNDTVEYGVWSPY